MNDLTPAEIEALSRVMGGPLSITEPASEDLVSSYEKEKKMTSDLGRTNISRAQFIQLEKESHPTPTSPPQESDQLQSVKIKLEVILGRTRMSVKNLLQLHEGSVIPLDKLAGEPVEILANGTAIALGEVVIIENNFGVKILQILE